MTSEQIIAAAPDVIIGSWCGKPVRREKIAARAGWDRLPAVRHGRIHEIKSAYILQPGPAADRGAGAAAADRQRLGLRIPRQVQSLPAEAGSHKGFASRDVGNHHRPFQGPPRERRGRCASARRRARARRPPPARSARGAPRLPAASLCSPTRALIRIRRARFTVHLAETTRSPRRRLMVPRATASVAWQQQLLEIAIFREPVVTTRGGEDVAAAGDDLGSGQHALHGLIKVLIREGGRCWSSPTIGSGRSPATIAVSRKKRSRRHERR